MSVCIFGADCHIRRSAWAGSGIDGDSHHSFTQVIDLTIKHEAPLLLGGDIFDSKKPEAEDVEFVRRQLDRLADRKLPVYFWQGNHEHDDRSSWLSAVHSWPTHVHEREFEPCGKLRFYGLDWLPGGAIRERLGSLPETDVLCYHGSCKELMNDRSGSRSSFSLAEVPCCYSLLGDYHATVELAYTPSGETAPCGRAYSPGSMHMTEIGELEDKYVYLLKEEGGGLNHSRLRLNTRPVYRFRLEDEAALKDFLTHKLAFVDEQLASRVKKLPEGLHRPLLRVVYSEEIPEAYSRIEVACKGKYHLFPKGLAAETRSREVIAAAEKLASGGLAAAIAGYTAPQSVKDDITTLLDAEDPSGAIDELCRRFLVCQGQR